MKLLSLTIVSIILPYWPRAQSLEGRWHWENESLEGVVLFDKQAYFIEVFVKNRDIKVAESFKFYRQSADTLIFSDQSFEANPASFESHLINEITDSSFNLLDLKSGEVDHYINVDHNHRKLSKYRFDQFYFNGGIACVSEEVNDNYNNCLNFTSISILSDLNQIEKQLGQPIDSVNQEGTAFFVYILPSDLKNPPYLALSLTGQNEINTLQLTGFKTNNQYAFSGIRLGDYYTIVEQRLGKPSTVEELDEQTQFWSYQPFPISFEIKNNLVYSIKLRRK